MGKLSQRLQWSVNEINKLALYNSTYRLVSFLLNQAFKDGKLVDIHLPTSKQILASQLTISPETLSRILQKLSKKGLIKIDKNCISLLKTTELKQLIGI